MKVLFELKKKVAKWIQNDKKKVNHAEFRMNCVISIYILAIIIVVEIYRTVKGDISKLYIILVSFIHLVGG